MLNVKTVGYLSFFDDSDIATWLSTQAGKRKSFRLSPLFLDNSKADVSLSSFDGFLRLVISKSVGKAKRIDG